MTITFIYKVTLLKNIFSTMKKKVLTKEIPIVFKTLKIARTDFKRVKQWEKLRMGFKIDR